MRQTGYDNHTSVGFIFSISENKFLIFQKKVDVTIEAAQRSLMVGTTYKWSKKKRKEKENSGILGPKSHLAPCLGSCVGPAGTHGPQTTRRAPAWYQLPSCMVYGPLPTAATQEPTAFYFLTITLVLVTQPGSLHIPSSPWAG